MSESLAITEKAAQRIIDCMKARGKGLGIRVKIRTTGCTGLAYVIEYADERNEHDHEFTEHGAHVFIDPKAMPIVQGATLDYIRRGLNEGFEFINPNEKNRCGCGESFTV
ncbi:MAG: iron-sulfur cluster assembly protein IscA [Gammaproteobacteria bacterium CG11_big_fil_rev_8_21_14_0_20_46_22]|nr:MAG: iron-sulfur cluster assembly protein IscA [Gammaproteobacteria bacterium CG12_big_fil_rev_8_21_14_0_65_46_12]PIR11680.1 MAG: iron-sulfur cluster assembly protein IscA [Gammaproteobacteria bacterium CG11_big_fil_rev_8_21_14_0_20_46_22]